MVDDGAKRFRLTGPELAAALSIGEIAVGPKSLLPSAPAPSNPVATLRASQTADVVLEGDKLKAECARVLETVASPSYFVELTLNTAGQRTWRRTFIAVVPETETAAALSLLPDGSFEFRRVSSVDEAVSALDRLASVSDLPVFPLGVRLDLTLPEYSALLAAADLLQSSRLEAKLARRLDAAPVVSTEAVMEQAKRGDSGSDTRWAVTLGRRIAPFGLATSQTSLTQGLDDLSRHGVLGPVTGGFVLTKQGYALASALGQIVKSAALTLAIPGPGGSVALVQVAVFRSATSIIFALWSGNDARECAVDVFDVNREQALGLFRAMLRPEQLPELAVEAPVEIAPEVQPEPVELPAAPPAVVALPVMPPVEAPAVSQPQREAPPMPAVAASQAVPSAPVPSFGPAPVAASEATLVDAPISSPARPPSGPGYVVPSVPAQTPPQSMPAPSPWTEAPSADATVVGGGPVVPPRTSGPGQYASPPAPAFAPGPPQHSAASDATMVGPLPGAPGPRISGPGQPPSPVISAPQQPQAPAAQVQTPHQPSWPAGSADATIVGPVTPPVGARSSGPGQVAPPQPAAYSGPAFGAQPVVQPTPRCPRCGMVVANDAAFCTSCGQAMRSPGMPPQAQAPVPPPAPAFCTRCGNQLKSDARFCVKCGAPRQV